MNSVKQFKGVGSAIARKSDGNPEGKGLNGFLLDWYQSEPTGIVAKPRRQLLAEFFTSMLVLSAAFKYRPAVGTVSGVHQSSPQDSAPAEWSAERQAAFAGTCVLQSDMTWTISPSDLLADNNTVSDAIGRFYDAFAELLNTDRTLEEILPFYVRRLPYYQRLYASALSRSMRAAVTLGDQSSTSCRQWHTLLPLQKDTLLSYAS